MLNWILRQFAFDMMGIAVPENPVATLHAAITAPKNAIVVRPSDGSALEPLHTCNVD